MHVLWGKVTAPALFAIAEKDSFSPNEPTDQGGEKTLTEETRPPPAPTEQPGATLFARQGSK